MYSLYSVSRNRDKVFIWTFPREEEREEKETKEEREEKKVRKREERKNNGSRRRCIWHVVVLGIHAAVNGVCV
jgi:cell division septal protein FtsQ